MGGGGVKVPISYFDELLKTDPARAQREFLEASRQGRVEYEHPQAADMAASIRP